jgi:hypothetical protein
MRSGEVGFSTSRARNGRLGFFYSLNEWRSAAGEENKGERSALHQITRRLQRETV